MPQQSSHDAENTFRYPIAVKQSLSAQHDVPQIYVEGAQHSMDPAERNQLYNRLIALCSQSGRVTDHTHELVDRVIESIDVTPEEASHL
jgi:hypothetical protein